MFYGIFMALYYVFISMSIFTFNLCWEIPCGEAFYIQLICGANQVKVFYMVWVSTVKSIQADSLFCCFNINKLSCYVIFRKGSCTNNELIGFLRRCRFVSTSGGKKLVVSLISVHQISFYAHMMPEFLLKISYLKFFAISTLLYTSSKMFPYMDNFFAKLRLGTSSRVSRVYFNLLYSMVEIFNFGKWRH